MDIYLLSEWEKPHPDPSVSIESPADRRKRAFTPISRIGMRRKTGECPLYLVKDHNSELTEYQIISLIDQAMHHPLLLKLK